MLYESCICLNIDDFSKYNPRKFFSLDKKFNIRHDKSSLLWNYFPANYYKSSGSRILNGNEIYLNDFIMLLPTPYSALWLWSKKNHCARWDQNKRSVRPSITSNRMDRVSNLEGFDRFSSVELFGCLSYSYRFAPPTTKTSCSGSSRK